MRYFHGSKNSISLSIMCWKILLPTSKHISSLEKISAITSWFTLEIPSPNLCTAVFRPFTLLVHHPVHLFWDTWKAEKGSFSTLHWDPEYLLTRTCSIWFFSTGKNLFVVKVHWMPSSLIRNMAFGADISIHWRQFFLGNWVQWRKTSNIFEALYWNQKVHVVVHWSSTNIWVSMHVGYKPI